MGMKSNVHQYIILLPVLLGHVVSEHELLQNFKLSVQHLVQGRHMDCHSTRRLLPSCLPWLEELIVQGGDLVKVLHTRMRKKSGSTCLASGPHDEASVSME